MRHQWVVCKSDINKIIPTNSSYNGEEISVGHIKMYLDFGGDGIHLEDVGDLRVIQAARCS